MKAVLFRRHGGPEVLEYADAPDPPVEPGSLVIRVKACALNHLDLWIRQGIPAYRIALPHISGCDVSGVVKRVGPGVTRVKAGDRVVLAPGISCGRCEACRAGQDNLCAAFGIRGAAIPGGYAELAGARAEDAIPIPERLSFEDAAAFPLVFLTAWHMLVGRAKLQAGESVLVHAAGSGVGHAAVQIAKHRKAIVYATVGSEAKVPKAKALGADTVINYRQDDFEARVKSLTGGRGVDVVFDHIGPDIWERNLRLLAKGGRLVTCGSTSGPSVTLDLRYVFSRQLSLLGSMMGTRAELDEVARLVMDGTLRPLVDAVFPLREARQAQERMEARDVFGKLVLVP
ncbi:MAG: zinc-binding dehydrogenase [Candidatus Omnitrophica bacterium]|nr:zinc-binding dehydrogenase [Candidatus Omnitrophota bacterium]